MINKDLIKHDYYRPPKPCRPHPGLEAFPAPDWDKAIAEHNLDVHSHPHLLELFKQNSSSYTCVSTLHQRDEISEEIRAEGLMAYVVAEDKVYRLESGITNEDWQELNINSKRFAKIGRHNPPQSPDSGTMYYDFNTDRLKVFITDHWVDIPNVNDLDQVKIELREEFSNSLRAELESLKIEIDASVDAKFSTMQEDLDAKFQDAETKIKIEVDEKLSSATEDIKNDVAETIDSKLEEVENTWFDME